MSDVLQCKLVHVGDRTYRMHTPALARQTPGTHEPARAYVPYNEDHDECILEDDPAIRKEDDMYSLPFRVDQELFPFIIGREGRKKKEIEESTCAMLHIPRTQQPPPAGAPRQKAAGSETITMKAADKADVLRAKGRLEALVSATLSSRSLDYTHFVSIPLQSPAIHSKLEEFQKQVLSAPYAADSRLDPSIFCDPSTLHLTVVMLKLYSDEARGRAQQLLKELQPAVQGLLGGRPLVLRLQGLEYMKDNPADVHVLYLTVHAEGPSGEAGGETALEQLFRMVFQRYKEAGLLVEGEREQLKIHATVINTRHRSSSATAQMQSNSSSSSPSGAAAAAAASSRIGIDARKLLEDHKDLDVGRLEVQALHLSQRGVYDKEGYYRALAQLPLK